MTLDELLRLYWTFACVWDGTPSDSKLAIFSEANPWVNAYNNLVMASGLTAWAVGSRNGGLYHVASAAPAVAKRARNAQT